MLRHFSRNKARKLILDVLYYVFCSGALIFLIGIFFLWSAWFVVNPWHIPTITHGRQEIALAAYWQRVPFIIADVGGAVAFFWLGVSSWREFREEE